MRNAIIMEGTLLIGRWINEISGRKVESQAYLECFSSDV